MRSGLRNTIQDSALQITHPNFEAPRMKCEEIIIKKLMTRAHVKYTNDFS